MIHYFIQIIAFQLLFLIVYDLMFKKETFFNWNRTYLLLTPILSLLLPFIQLESIRQSIPEAYLVQLPAVIVGDGAVKAASIPDGGLEFSWLFVWYAGMLVSSLFFVVKISKLLRVTRLGRSMDHPVLTIKLLPGSNTAFTFFSTIYLGEDLTKAQMEKILLHEEIHARHRHSWDLFFFELLRIVFWFNPLVYIFQQRIGALHEYTADRKIATGGETDYYQELLSQVFQTNKVSFINTFFNHSLIKNRIVMLQKSNSKKIVQLKYLLLAPVICGMLVYTSCAQETPETDSNTTVVEFQSDSDSEILQRIADLKESIAAKGEVTKEEAQALKMLIASTQKDLHDDKHAMYFDDKSANGAMSFSAINKVPVYPGCEGMENKAAQKCFTEKVASFVVSNFDTKKFKNSSIQGRQRIAVHFVIGEDGVIKDVKAKAEYEPLMLEAVRVVKLLPTMQPGEHEGKKVNVQFALPIIFELE